MYELLISGIWLTSDHSSKLLSCSKVDDPDYHLIDILIETIDQRTRQKGKKEEGEKSAENLNFSHQLINLWAIGINYMWTMGNEFCKF